MTLVAGLVSSFRQARTYALVALGIVLLAVPYLVTDIMKALTGNQYPFVAVVIAYGFIFGIYGLAFNLLLGYSGLVSFGHAGLFALGAYVQAIMIRHLPVQFTLEVYVILATATCAAVCAVYGLLLARRVSIFFGILTLALGMVLYSLFLKLWFLTGGTDGLRLPTPALLGMTFAVTKEFWLTKIYYYYLLAALVLCAIVIWVIVNSPFGKTLQAIRDNETRANFIGVRVYRYRWLAFILSGAFTGLAGCLWGPLNGHVTPEIAYWTFSGEIVFLTVLGGFSYFSGPIIGGMIFTIIKTYAIGLTVYWSFVLGVILIFLLFVMPRGLVGGCMTVYGKIARRSHSRKSGA